jgi:diguanylate cyclase (GGDEF)-like protein
VPESARKVAHGHGPKEPRTLKRFVAAEDRVGELLSLIRVMARHLGADSALVVVVDEESKVARIPCAWGLPSIGAAYSFEPDEGFVGRALIHGGPLMERLSADPLESIHLTDGVPIKAALGAPVRTATGVAGVLCAGFGDKREADRDMLLKAIASYAVVVGLWLEDPTTLAGLLRSAYEDGLTGCFTYTALLQTLEHEIKRCERYGHALSCCFIDLDDFKAVNDTRGHAAGNRVLAAVGAAVRARVREVDVVGRYGGDEFVVLLPDTTSLSAGILVDALHDEIRAATRSVLGTPMDATIGVAEWIAGMAPEDLLEQAGLVLRDAKLHS